MKKLTTSVLAVVLTASFGIVSAQQTQSDTLRTQDIREVVVTGALGIKKRQDAVVSSNKVVGDKELNQAASQSISQALISKVSGLQINTTNSGVNPTTKIILRGFRSISGDTNPLVVIDGVVATMNVFNQLPPDIVENINVIKGQQGAALYGSLGSNGVLVVTTKRGTRSERISVNLSSSVEFTNSYKLPIRQRLFGQGYPGEADYSDVDYGGTNWVPYENTAWGPAFNDPNIGGQLIEVGLPQANGEFLRTTYSAKKGDNIRNFFDTGIQFKNGFNVSTGGADSYTFLSYDRLENEFIVPGDKLKRNTVFFKGGKKIGKFRMDGNVSIIDQSTHQTNGNLYAQLLQTPTNVDIRDFRNSGFAGNYTSFAYNPYALRDISRGDSRLTSSTGIISLGYEFNDHISLTYNGSLYMAGQEVENHTDAFNSNEIIINAPGTGIDGATLRQLGVAAITSAYNKQSSRVRNYYGDLILNFKYDLTNDINFSANIGNNITDNFSSTTSAGGTNLRIPYFYNISNVVNPTPAYNLNNTYIRSRQYAFFANVDLGLKDYLFVNLTGRIEQSSRLSARPTGTTDFSNKGIPYYSGGVSFIPTKAFDGLKDNSVLNYLKISGSYTVTGNAVISAYDNDEVGVFPTGYPLLNSSFLLNKNPTNQFIKPEANKTLEGNIFLGFLKDRITIEGSAFQTDTDDLITGSTTSATTGIVSLTNNIGNIRNSGFEVDLGITPFKSENFEWSLRGSYSKYESLVKDLGPGVDEVGLTQDAYGIPAGVFAVKGERFPVIKGIKYERDPNGNIIVDQTGLPVTNSKYQILGKVTPDYILGFSTNVRYKGLTLAVTADYRTGNSFISDTKSLLGFAGALEKTVEFDRAQGYIIPGSVQNTGTATNPIYTPNTTTVGDDPSYAGTANYFSGAYQTSVGEEFVVDGTALKIREISLAYQIPKSVLSSTFVRSLSVGVYARNAFAWYAKSNRNFADPETSNGGVGGIAVTSQYPTTRTFGFSLNASF